MSILKDTLILAHKDIKLEFRKKETIFSLSLFSFASVLIFSTLLNLIDISLLAKQALSAASLWLIITFMVMLGISSLFSRELKSNSIYQLLSLSVKPQAIVLAKLVYLNSILLFIELITLIFAVVFLRLDIQSNFLILCMLFVFGTLDLSIAGCIVSFLTIYTKSKTLATPILFFPLILPSVLIATQATTNILIFDAFQLVLNDLLVLLLHGIIILAFILLVSDELIGE